MNTPYIERDCTITHEGRTFESGGAVVADEYVIGYVGKKIFEPSPGWGNARDLTDWHGNTIGTCHITASWPIPGMWGSHMHQIHATVNGKLYTGRGMGEGMICRLRLCKGRS